MNDFWERVDEPGLKVAFNGPQDTCGGDFPIGFCGQSQGMIRQAVEYYRNLNRDFPRHPNGIETLEHRGIGGMCLSCSKVCRVVIEVEDGRPTERLKFVFTDQ